MIFVTRKIFYSRQIITNVCEGDLIFSWRVRSLLEENGVLMNKTERSFQKIMIFHRFLKLSQGMTLKRYHYLSRKNSVITQGKLTSFFHTRMLKLKIGLMTFLKDVSMILGLTRMRSPKMSIFSYIQC